MKTITLETIYDKMIALERDIVQIKKKLTEEPELRNEYIAKMSDIDEEKSHVVKDFGKRYGLKK